MNIGKAFDAESSVMKAVDWSTAFITLGFGLWTSSYFMIGCAFLGFILAWVRPALIIKRLLLTKIGTRRS